MLPYLCLFHHYSTMFCVERSNPLSLTLDICFHLHSSPRTTRTERHLWTLSKCDRNCYEFQRILLLPWGYRTAYVLILKTETRNLGRFLMTAGIILRAQRAPERWTFFSSSSETRPNVRLFGDRRKASERKAGGKDPLFITLQTTEMHTHSEPLSFKLENIEPCFFIWFSLYPFQMAWSTSCYPMVMKAFKLKYICSKQLNGGHTLGFKCLKPHLK